VPLRVTFKEAGAVATVLTVPPLELAVNSITFSKGELMILIVLFLALSGLRYISFDILLISFATPGAFHLIRAELAFESTAKFLFLAVVPLHNICFIRPKWVVEGIANANKSQTLWDSKPLQILRD
jgi:hypothetical protein